MDALGPRSLVVRHEPGPVDGPVLATRAEARRLLGTDVDALTVDLRERIDFDLLGMAHGLVRGGGTLTLVLPDVPAGHAERRLFDACARGLGHATPVDDDPLAEQDRLVAHLTAILAGDPSRIALTADRGRGKSAAVGRALAALPSDLRIALTGPDPAATEVIRRFADRPLPAVRPAELLREPRPVDLLVVDEAAALSVPLLTALADAHPDAHQLYCTTTHGYEGTGRGFALRFLGALARGDRPLHRLSPSRPIRWDPGDPLERWFFDLLLLDAEPIPADQVADAGPDTVTARELDRAALARDEPTLRDLFGLLVQAHYRTTPADLQHLLDAPGLHVHGLFHDGRVVGVCLVAEEGGLTEAQSREIAFGSGRIRGHALADTLVCHGCRVEAGALRMIRSVRTAVHPAARGRGLARILVEHVHARHQPDLFGTLFGAETGLVRFRQALGYQAVRLGASAGTRTGLPSAVMVRPVSPAAQELVRGLREDLARDLSRAVLHVAAETGRPLSAGLVRALAEDLPSVTPFPTARIASEVAAWADGPRPYEAAETAIEAWLRGLPEPWPLPEADRALLRERVFDRTPWWKLARDRDQTVPQVMRALKRAARALV